MTNYQVQVLQPYPPMGQPPAGKRKMKVWIWILLGAVALCVCGAVCCGFLLKNFLMKNPGGEGIAQLLAQQAEELGYENALSELTVDYAVRVGENTYYRLQQNYCGLPVVGRSVVYVTDGWGRHVGNSHNLQDIPAGFQLQPALQPVDAAVGIIEYIWKHYPVADASNYVVPEDMQLCIYNLSGEARLAYTYRMAGLIWVVDATNGMILETRDIVLGLGAGNPLDAVSDALNIRGREYAKMAEEKEIYLYTAATQTYYDPTGRVFQVQRLWQADMEDNSLGNILLIQDRYDNAAAALEVVCGIGDVFEKDLKTTEGGPIILVVDDFLDGQKEYFAAAAWGTAGEFLGYQLPEALQGREDELLGMIILGSEMMLDPIQGADIIGHEYMHVLADKRVNWRGEDPQTWAVAEGVSDLMGQLLQMLLDPKAEPDWTLVIRPIADPQAAGYPVHVGQYGEFESFQVLSPTGSALDAEGMPYTADYAHFYSTVISHAGYRMWKGIDGQALETAQLAQLLYRTVLMLPADADFADFRRILTMNAQWMELTELQRQCVETAMEYAQIPDQTILEPAFAIGEKCQVQVLDDGEPVDGYQITVTAEVNAQTLPLETSAEKTWKGSAKKPGTMQLACGIYTAELTLPGAEQTPIRFMLRVSAGGAQTLEISTYRPSEGEAPQLVPEETESGADTWLECEIPYVPKSWERVYTDSEQGWHKRYYLSYPELQGDSTICRVINADILSAVSQQISSWENSVLLYLEQPQLGSEGKPVDVEEGFEIQVSYMEDGVLCLLLKHNGVAFDSVFYSLRTATPIWNYVLAGTEPDRFLEDVKRYIWWYVTEAQALPVEENAQNSLANMRLEDFGFAIVKGELVVLNLLGQEMIPTGLRCSRDYLDRLENGMPAYEKADALAVDKLTWDRNYDVPMQDPRAKERYTTYECTYLQLQGSGDAIVSINGMIYDVVSAFMQDKTEEEVRADWFGYGVHRGFYMNGNMEQGYNADGIFSVQMKYYGHLGSMRDTEEERDFEGYYGMTFDVKTGKKLTIADLTGLSEEVLRVLLRERRFGPDTFAALRGNTLAMPGDEAAWDRWLETCDLLACPVSVAEDGQILLYVARGSLAGVADAKQPTYFIFCTGMYIGADAE